MKSYNKARLEKLSKMIKIPFQHNWQFRLGIAGAPVDLDFYVKDISYGPIEIETDEISVGAGVITMPKRARPVTISMTMRDNQDERIFDWMAEWAGKVVNSSSHAQINRRGTVNIPQEYLRKVTRYQLLSGPNDTFTEKKSAGRIWEVFPTQVGDISESREGESIAEFPVTLIQMLSV